ncbi:hypothetical protein [Streptomyces sp. NPDC052012]|uniref:hypothetical protein n=1 Tax=Streptomyces sp. NPDC052012 TaxID=3155051 RepID=UPI00344BB86D
MTTWAHGPDAGRRGDAARRPLRAVAAIATLVLCLLTLTLGATDGTHPTPSAGPHGTLALPPATGPAAPPAPGLESSGAHPVADDAYVACSSVLARPQRDAGERSVPAGPLLFTPPYTPRVPPRPAPPVPASGNARPAAAHLPSDLGRAPPAPSST